jgi:hypothetical protein
VTTELDIVNAGDGLTSLREAVTLANGTAAHDTITFANSLADKKVNLQHGQMTISRTVTIQGLGKESTTVDGQHNSRLFDIASTAGNVTFDGLTLTRGQTTAGNSPGAAVRSLSTGNLTFVLSSVTGSKAGGNGGGGIYSIGSVMLTQTTVSGNNTYGTVADGGGIHSRNNVTLTDSSVSGNNSSGGSGGGIFSWGGVTLTRSTISGNIVSGNSRFGGGIFARSGVTLAQSTVSGNSTSGDFGNGGGIFADGAGVTLLDSTVSDNHTTGYKAGGGGMFSHTGVTLTGSTVIGNTTAGNEAHGGGILCLRSVTLILSRVSGNSTAGNLALGGGIYSAADDVTLTQSTVSGNTAGGLGGGIFSRDNVTLTESTVSGNSTSGDGDSGGGIFAQGTVSLSRSSVSGNNTTGRFSHGGGVYSFAGNVTLTESTVSGNSTSGDDAWGGGILSRGAVTLTQSTVSGNSTSGTRANGGGIVIESLGGVTLNHSTVTANRSSRGSGGGIRNLNGPILINGSIVALNTASSGPDLLPGTGMVSLNYSLIGDNAGTGLSEFQTPDFKGNLVGSSAGSGIIDPRLGLLADNGGPTQTHALLAGSRAIDAGDPMAGSVPPNDQRGAPFIRVFNGDGAGSARIDMGAYERQTVAGIGLVVDTLAEESDGNYSLGDRSLREMLGLANGSVDSPQTIAFATSLTSAGPATILLSRGELFITDSLTINGPGANLLTIDASGNDRTPMTNNGDGSRVINVNDFTSTVQTVSITGLTLTGGDLPHPGGGIGSLESLTLTACAIINNSASIGGGIYIQQRNLNLIDSTISGNAANRGGGIETYQGTLNMTNCTVSGNIAFDRGGGIFARDTELNIRFSTIVSNAVPVISFDRLGGGIHSTFLIGMDLVSTIVANNHNFFGTDDILGNVDLSFSLIGDATGATILNNPIIGSRIGSAGSPINPLLGPLADNGGATKTHALLAGSPAINAGNPSARAGIFGVPQYDQRGLPFGRVSGGRIDMGAFESRTNMPGDFSGNGVIDSVDIDLLAAAAANDPSNVAYDLNGDGSVTYSVSPAGSIVSDSDVLIRTVLRTQYGDLNLDGEVFLADLAEFATNYRQLGSFGWADGNIDGTATSPQVFLADLSVLATYWRFGVGPGSASGAALSDPHAISDTASTTPRPVPVRDRERGFEMASSDSHVAPFSEPIAAPAKTAAARAARIAVTQTLAAWRGSRSRGNTLQYRRAELAADDLLLLALDRVQRSARQAVTMIRHSDPRGASVASETPTTVSDLALADKLKWCK